MCIGFQASCRVCARSAKWRAFAGDEAPKEPETEARFGAAAPELASGPLIVHALGTVCVHHARPRETTMATSAERMRALREHQRRGVRRLAIDVSEDDLRAIAKRVD